MEFLNKIELVGLVHQVKPITLETVEMVKFTMATNYAYRNKQGLPVVETTWHTILVQDTEKLPASNKLEKNAVVKVAGRIHTSTYTDQYGCSRFNTEIIASALEVLDKNTDLKYQM